MSTPKAAENNFIKLTDDEFYDQFEFVTNHFDDNASYDGNMFETYGVELEHVLSVANSKEGEHRVWTIMDDDDGNMCICNGYHLVNRIGYLITTTPCLPNTEYFIQDPQDDND